MENATQSQEDDGKLSAWLIPQSQESEIEIAEDKNDEINNNDNKEVLEFEIEDEEERKRKEKDLEPSKLHRLAWVVLAISLYLCFLLPLSLLLLSFLQLSFPLFSFMHPWAEVFPLSTFFIFFFANVAGFSFVARITEKRTNPLKCRASTYTHLGRLLLVTPLVFIIGPIRILSFSSSSFSSSSSSSPSSPSSSSLSFSSSPPIGTPQESIVFNVAFLFSFFVGLQFTYLDYIMLFRTAGDKFGSPSLWKTYTKRELLLIIPIILFILLLVAWHFHLIIEAKLAAWYGIFYLIVALILIVPTYICRKTHYLHFHHYAIFVLLVPFFAFPNYISSISLGVVTGVYVEGVARWGMVSWWHKGNQRVYEFS